MISQTELSLPSGTPTLSTEAELLRIILRDADGWISARALAPAIGGDDRAVRACAAELADEVISGQRGYRHVTRATPEEIAHFVHWMRSQARQMLRRTIRLQRRAHQVIG